MMITGNDIDYSLAENSVTEEYQNRAVRHHFSHKKNFMNL